MTPTHHTPEGARFIRVPAAATRLDVSPQYLYAEISAGRLRAYRFGRAVRIALADLDAYIEAAR